MLVAILSTSSVASLTPALNAVRSAENATAKDPMVAIIQTPESSRVLPTSVRLFVVCDGNLASASPLRGFCNPKPYTTPWLDERLVATRHPTAQLTKTPPTRRVLPRLLSQATPGATFPRRSRAETRIAFWVALRVSRQLIHVVASETVVLHANVKEPVENRSRLVA